VFVLRGDATALACDWRLITSGTRAGKPGDVGAHWLRDQTVRDAVASENWVDRAPNASRRAVVISDPTAAPHGAPGIVAVHTGERGNEVATWFAKGLSAAVEILPRRKRHLRKRAVPLIVTPMLGTGAGGAADRRAGVLEELLWAAWGAANKGWDVAIVVRDGQTYSAAQRLRAGSVGGWDLKPAEKRLARELSEVTRAGKLVPFLGAGASAAAGMPGWRDLLALLAREVGLGSKAQRGELLKMDPRDAAHILQRRFGDSGADDSLDAALRRVFEPHSRASLVHALVGSLPIYEAATTNYDRLFELAWHAGSDSPITVLPRQDGMRAERWLLKLHGDVDDRRRRLVLSRSDYLHFENQSGAVAGVLHAMLLTRHLLILGYGLTDETFHRIAHEVREVRMTPIQRTVQKASSRGVLGTALLVTKPDLSKEVWGDDLELVDLTRGGADDMAHAARRQEVLLDLVAHHAAPAEAYLLGDGWERLSEAGRSQDRRLRDGLEALAEIRGLSEPLERALDDVLRRFGRPPPAGRTG
jgi:hypothetical protein